MEGKGLTAGPNDSQAWEK